MFAANTDIPCVLTDIPYILFDRRARQFFSTWHHTLRSSTTPDPSDDKRDRAKAWNGMKLLTS